MSSDQEVTTLQHFNEQAQVLSGGNQRVLKSLTNTLNTQIQRTINGIAQETSTDLQDNKDQVKKVVKETVEDLDKTLKRKFSKSLLAIFSSLHENLRDNNDLSAFNFETWITNNINSLEENLGSQCVPSHKVLNLINDLSNTWTDKIEKIKATIPAKQADSPFSEISRPVGNPTDDLNWVKDQAHGSGNKDFEEISETKSVKSSTGKVDLKTEGKSKSETGTSDTRSSGFMSKFKGMFKGGAQEAGGATKVNLGDEKNFHWDPIKKKYVFDGEEDVPEEEDQGPPPAMMKTAPKEETKTETKENEKTPEEAKKLEAKNLMLPPSHRALSRKKEKGKGGPAGGAEPKKPAFMPAMFVPAAKIEESHQDENKENQSNKIDQDDDDFVGKTASGEEVLKKIDEIFEQHKTSHHKMMDLKKFKTIFEVVENVLGREMKQKLEKDMEVALLQRELDSTSEALTRESSQRRLVETELTILRERVEKSAFSEQDLSIRLEDLEKEVEMYKEACSSKSEILSLVNESDYQEKIIEAHFKSLQDANEQKKKAMEARNEVRTLEMKLCEKDIEAKVWEERYKEIQRQNEEGKKLPQKLRTLIEEYMNTQNEQDGIIVRLKEENCEVLKQYRKAFEELGRMAEENVKTGEEVRQKKQEIHRLQKNIQEKERDLEDRTEKIRAMENEIKLRGGRVDQLEENLQQALDEKKNLEEKRENEAQDFEKRIDELQTNIEGINREKDELSQEKQDIISQRDQLYEEKERLLEEREQILAEKQRLETEREQLENSKENLEKQNEELYRDKEELFEEKERIVAENNSLLTERQLISSQKESLEKFGEELTNKNLHLENKVQELETFIKGLKSEKFQWKEALVSFVKELEQEELTEDREHEPSELFAIVRGYMEETVQNCEEAEVVLRLMGVLTKVRECVESKIKALNAKAKLEKEEAQIRIENLHKEKLLMTEVEVVMKEEIKKLRETTEQQLSVLNDAQTQVQDLTNKNEALETQLRSEQENWEQEKRRFDDLLTKEAQSIQDLEEKTQNVATLEQELQKRNEELHQIQTDYEEQIKKLKEENEELQQQIEEGFTQYSFLQGKTKETIEQINQLSNDNELYRNELENLRAELDIKNVLESQNIALKEEIEGLNERINILSEELQVKDGHLHDLRSSGIDQEVHELRAKLQEAENKPRSEDNTAALNSLEQRIQELEQENQTIKSENEQYKRNAALLESNKDAQVSDDGIDGDKLCASIERIYGDSLVFGYLKDFVEQMKTEKNVTTFKASLDLVGSFDEVLERLKREIDEKSVQVQMLTRVIESGGGAQVAAKVETPEVPKVEENNELIEQLKKEIEDRKQEIKELLTEIIRLRDELGEEDPKSPEDPKKKTEPTVKEMKKELKKEQDKYKKLVEENETNKKKVKYLDEERGAIQNSYAQIIRNLGQEIDDLKRKKGIPVATTSTKSIQTEDEDTNKTVGQEPNSAGKASSFFSGVAKWI